MVVIANDCVGGELYRLCDEEFKSPFIWTVLPIKDFTELYKNYDNINFKNITYNQTPNYYFSWYMSSLNIDNKVNVYFPHHAKIENNKVYVNDEELNEPYIHNEITEGDIDTVVPDGAVFVLGDNREISLDSRYDSVGFISKSDILGKVFVRLYPFNKIGLLD